MLSTLVEIHGISERATVSFIRVGMSSETLVNFYQSKRLCVPMLSQQHHMSYMVHPKL